MRAIFTSFTRTAIAITTGEQVSANTRWHLEKTNKLRSMKNFWLVQLWRDAPPRITIWGKIWRTVLMVGFWAVVLWIGLKWGFGGFEDSYY
jgi:hypothetical protein